MRNVWRWAMVGLLCGCDSGVEPFPLDDTAAWPAHGISVDAAVELGARFVWTERDELTFELTASNPTGRPVELFTGPCPLRVRAYATEELLEPASWEARYAERSVCSDEGIVYVLPPGPSEVLSETFQRDRMAMGLPRFSGYFGVVVRWNEVITVLPAGGFRPPA